MSRFLYGIIGAISLALAGCTLLDIDRMSLDKGLDYQMWKKAGASELEVRKALLECGAPNPQGYMGAFAPGQRGANDLNVWATAYLCMEKAGFHWKTGIVGYESVRKEWCQKGNAEPVCGLPESEIPTRSVQRRLNSDFCHKFKNARACQP